jgi:hypothetical protein
MVGNMKAKKVKFSRLSLLIFALVCGTVGVYFIFFASGESSPAIFYVDKDSRGGTCSDSRLSTQNTITTPWCTIGQAMDAAPSGSTVLVRAGVYPKATTKQANAALVTFKANRGEKPTIKGLNAVSGTSNYRFEGFLINDVSFMNGDIIQLVNNEITPNGIYLNGSNLLVEGNNIHDLTMEFINDPSPTITRCSSSWKLNRDGGDNDQNNDGVFDYPLSKTGSVYPRCGYALRATGTNVMIRSNLIKNVPADALQMNGTTNLTFQNNSVYRVDAFIDPLEHTDGVQLFGPTMNTKIIGNYFKETRGVLPMIRQSDVTYGRDITIKNNAFYNTYNLVHGNGCIAASAGINIKIINNTCAVSSGVSTGGGIRFLVDVKDPNPVGHLSATVMNNITVDLTVDNVNPITVDYNLVSIYRITQGISFSKGLHSIAGSATYIDRDELRRLGFGSLGIDQGSASVASLQDRECRGRVDIQNVPNGAGGYVDMGAYEYQGTGNPCSSPKEFVGDLNEDSKVNVLDLSILLSNYGKPASQATNPASDINNNGTVDILDLSILLAHYGE